MRPDRARSLADPARPFQNEVVPRRGQAGCAPGDRASVARPLRATDADAASVESVLVKGGYPGGAVEGAENPNGYDCANGTGVACPVGLGVSASTD